VTIYIPLIHEGTPVVRPTQGVPMGGNVFLVRATADYDPNDEIWEFMPGSTVNCFLERHEGDDILVARSLAP
jgi:hypothetical protein